MTEKGVVRVRAPIPKTSTYWNRDYAGAMGGVLGLLMVDTFNFTGGYLSYTVQLETGKTITLWSKTDVPEGSCINLWLRRDPNYREDHYSQKYNEIELATGCTAPLPGDSGTGEK